MIRRSRHYLLVLFVAWIIYILSGQQTYLASSLFDKDDRILLLTAHPDDECMFFAPTIAALVQNGIKVFSLCLSIGNADGLGDVRPLELKRSLAVLGVPADHSEVVNHTALQDNIHQSWDPEIIADVLKPFVEVHNITTILTFDERGVSNHPNHYSLPLGAVHLLRSMPNISIRLLSLKTVPTLPKYTGLFSPIVTHIWYSFVVKPRQPVFVAGFKGYRTALQAMYQHWSQLVWFRWLYVLFSRYMWVNEWLPVHIA
ncbi:hypothetical protein M422DRAFT_258186 [Sphaerobolus stellatus SS14]|uniref:N-acetylglucosaminylphosphatidylinositol deacetylase n=1 Tax=Sphaerobolus stellatus (strain SS14) TaxID=990650 RepID=A0A0C9VBU0_SPHS4|nr:hypothetical protein M422DRAFT_258186 [Sphaerobolus stellatus SS14]